MQSNKNRGKTTPKKTPTGHKSQMLKARTRKRFAKCAPDKKNLSTQLSGERSHTIKKTEARQHQKNNDRTEVPETTKSAPEKNFGGTHPSANFAKEAKNQPKTKKKKQTALPLPTGSKTSRERERERDKKRLGGKEKRACEKLGKQKQLSALQTHPNLRSPV